MVFVVFVYRLFYVQISRAEVYKDMAEEQQALLARILPARGEIKVLDKFSTTAYPIATNVKKPLVYAIPGKIQDVDKTASELGKTLDMDVEVLKQRLSMRTRSYVPLKREISNEEKNAVESLNLPGIEFDFETSRFYPEKDMLSSVLGFVGYRHDSGSSKVGVYGLERSYEQQLAGETEVINSVKDAKGLWLFGPDKDLAASKDGSQLILSIDRTIQLNVERVLADTVSKHQADGGCIIVIDPHSGAVLAMASNPTFDPNEYGGVEDERVFQNLCTMGNYEPGSVFKPVTMAAALDVGSVKPETTYEDFGQIEIDDYTIKNSDPKPNGEQNMVQVLEKSLNTGMIFIQQSLGNARFKSYVGKFGFGAPTGVDVSENQGNLDNLSGSISVNYATASFGQGISVTPLQMVRSYTAFANKGKMVKPYLVSTQISPSGLVTKTEAVESEEVISPKTAATIGAMLVSVVENGHGKKAGVPGYFVAGKTGTAQVARKDGRGYDPNNNIGTFVGYAPVDDPKFVMLVRVDHPRTVQYAENTAAPAFGELAKFLLSYFNVPPTR